MCTDASRVLLGNRQTSNQIACCMDTKSCVLLERHRPTFRDERMDKQALHSTEQNTHPKSTSSATCILDAALSLVQFKGHTMSMPFKVFNIALAALMAVTSIASSIAAVRYIVVSCIRSGKQFPDMTLYRCLHAFHTI